MGMKFWNPNEVQNLKSFQLQIEGLSLSRQKRQFPTTQTNRLHLDLISLKECSLQADRFEQEHFRKLQFN